MKLSEHAWKNSSNVIKKIFDHQFNQELMKGTLSKEKFAYYLEQDIHFIYNFAKCLTLIASKIQPNYKKLFLQFSDLCISSAQDLEAYLLQKIGLTTPATISYNKFLFEACAHEPIEIAIAAILPCFWVYREVGMYIFNNSSSNNQYTDWINKYSSETYSKSVDQVIYIFDELSINCNETTRENMLKVFSKSTYLEWKFWDDAYKLLPVIFKSLSIISV